MNKIDPSRYANPLLVVLTVLLLAGVGLAIVHSQRTWHVTIAAGGASGESYIMAKALKTVVERKHPELKVTLLETGGTSENLAMLERGDADLATAQADVPAGRSARLVAILYADTFQLLVPKDSKVRSFAALKGKVIDLPTKGGQFKSFLTVAEHFGLTKEDFRFQEGDASGAGFLASGADALFRVRAMGNPVLSKLAREGRVRLVPIDQAPAMRIRTPALEPSIIPRGAYLGAPTIPEDDTPTVIVKRTLLAHQNAGAEPIAWLTQCLLEDREEIAQAIPQPFAEVRPLLAGIGKPEDSGIGYSIHHGAQLYYEKDKPSFIRSNADYLGLLLSIVVLGGSWLWEIHRWLTRRQKNRADAYNHEIITLLNRVQNATTARELAEIRVELTKILTDSVNDLDVDQISTDSFNSVRSLWQITTDAVRERQASLEAELPPRASAVTAR